MLWAPKLVAFTENFFTGFNHLSRGIQYSYAHKSYFKPFVSAKCLIEPLNIVKLSHNNSIQSPKKKARVKTKAKVTFVRAFVNLRIKSLLNYHISFR